MNEILFVYGFLKPGFRLHHIVSPYVVRSDPAVAAGRLYDAGLPAAVFDGGGEIEGFALRLDRARLEEALAILDDVEDEGEVYRRVLVRVRVAGAEIEAMAYEYIRPLDGLAEVGSLWRRE